MSAGLANGAPAPAAGAAAEHAAARSGCALVDLSERGLLEVTGPLRQKFLHNILSNQVELPPGGGSRAALMDVRGHLQVVLRVSVAADRVLLEMPGDRLDAIEAALVHYRVGSPVRFARVASRVLGVLGPQAGSCLAGLGLPLPGEEPEQHVAVEAQGTPLRVIRAGDLPAGGFALHVPDAELDALRQRLLAAGARELSRATLDALRIEDGRPWYGPDVGPDNLLHETGLVDELHSSSKGCYVGQEVVARLVARGGNVSRHLRGLRLEQPAQAGDPIEHEGRGVGQVTTAGLSPALGPVAMGYVHRDASEPETRLSVAGAPARVVRLPLRPPTG